MIARNIRLAFKTLRNAKWRSLMTMTGIILGIVSVVTIVSLGEGIKRQVLGQISRQGGDLITVRPGNLITRDKAGNIVGISNLDGLAFGNGSLGEGDLDIVGRTPGVDYAVPLALVNSSAKMGEEQLLDGTVIATSAQLPAALNQKVNYGKFFQAGELDRHVTVIGKRVAEQLFKENVPIGRSLTIRGQDFVVIGIFEEFASSPLPLNPDFNKTIFIPYDLSKELGSGSQLIQILVRPQKGVANQVLISNLNQRLHEAHGGQNDFTLLAQDENLLLVSRVFDLFTTFIGGVAAIMLVIGGIGIMNIMLVLVSERTREIGIRKAIGATNRQIAGQFFVEATVLSCVGGAIGILLAYAINLSLRILTHLQPVTTWPVVLIASGVSLAIGIVFGLIPAVRAARKDPIEALRYE